MFKFNDYAVPTTVYGSGTGDGKLVCQAPVAPRALHAPVLVSLSLGRTMNQSSAPEPAPEPSPRVAAA